MNSYQRNQVPYPPMYYPPVQPQVKMEPARSPSAYEPWPWDGSYGYHYPVQCHGCCNHNYFPGHFMMRPPYPHVPPLYSYGYPPAPGAYPVQFSPPPHYTMEVPCYECNKDMPGEHNCCGCPNHSHIRKEGKSVKIEEEEPELVERKGNQSAVPFEFKNYPYPIVWLPPGYMKAKEKRRSDDSEQEGWDKNLHGNSKSFEKQPTTWNGWFPFGSNNFGLLKQGEDHKKNQHNQGAEGWESSKLFEDKPKAWNGWFPLDANNLGLLKQGEDHKRSHHNQDPKVHENSKSFEDQPPAWNGWFPLDANKLRSLMQSEDHKKSQHNQDDKQSSFPFPVFWMLYKPDITEKEEPKEICSQQGPPSRVDSAPVKLYDTEAKREGDIKDEGTRLADRNTIQKTIPVKQVEQNEGKNTAAEAGDKGTKLADRNIVQKIIPVKQVEQNEEKHTSKNAGEKAGGKKSPEDGAKKRSSSPQKTSKLLPVCLRIDPLPKKRKHAPSGKPSERTMPSMLKDDAEQDVRATDSKTDRSKVEHDKNKLKSVDVSEGTTIQEESGKLESAPAHSSEDKKTITQIQKVSSEGHQDKACSDVKGKRCDTRDISEAKETVGTDAKNSSRIKLSETEAAVVIQSAFRGFEVRKWEPLKKLKQLAKIKEQMVEMKKHIQALESSSDTSGHDKQEVNITEMIMNLLLKLDTIQGVHPSIREIRKSVAKELVSLQENLDLLINKNMKECVEQPSSTLSEDNVSREIREDVGPEGENEEYSSELKCSLLTAEPDQPLNFTDVVSHSKDAVSNSKDEEISYSMMATGNPDEETSKLSGIGYGTRLQPAMEIGVEDKEEQIANSSVVEALNDCDGKRKQTFEFQQVEGKTTSAAQMADPTLTYKIEDVHELTELPPVTIEANNDSEAPGEHEKTEQRDDEVPESGLTKDLIVVPENNEVKDLNKVELLQEEGQKEQVISNSEDKLGGEESEIPIMEAAGEVLPELHEIPIQIQEEENSRDAPPEFLKAETEAGLKTTTETMEAGGANSDEPSRKTYELGVGTEEPEKISKLEEPLAAKVLRELPIVYNEMQDESRDHGAPKANSLLGSEAIEVAPRESEAFVEASKEHKVEDSMEGLEEKDIGVMGGDSEIIGHSVSVADSQVESNREASVPSSARAVENDAIVSITGNDEIAMATQPRGSACAEYEELAQMGSMDGNSKRGNEVKLANEVNLSPSSSTSSQFSHVSDILTESDRKLIEENEKLREMMEKLIEAGNKQLNTISSLSGRIKDLEKRLSKKKKLKIKRPRTPASGSSCLKTKNDSLKERVVGLAV